QTANTMRMVRAFAPKHSAVVAECGLDPGKTKYYKLPEGTLEVITSSATAAEGAEGSFAVADETEHWVPSNGGPELMATLADNLAKSGSRLLETANAWKPGIGAVAEATWEDWVAQEEGRLRGESRVLYDARIAPPDTDMSDPDSLRRALEWVYGDCDWKRGPDGVLDVRPIMQRVWRKSARPDDSKRKYLNWPTAPDDAWTTPQAWAAMADPAHVVPDGAEIVMFFDGSKSRDATALIGCEVDSGHVFEIGVWEPDPAHDSDDVVPVPLVDAAVDLAFNRWRVLAFFADVKEWESFTKVTWPERYADRLLIKAVPGGKQPEPIAWDMRSHVYDFTMACEHTEAEIAERAFTHDGSAVLARHVANMRRRPNRWGVAVAKETPDSPMKIDAGVCMIGARMVRRLLLASDAYKSRSARWRPSRRYGFGGGGAAGGSCGGSGPGYGAAAAGSAGARAGPSQADRRLCGGPPGIDVRASGCAAGIPVADPPREGQHPAAGGDGRRAVAVRGRVPDGAQRGECAGVGVVAGQPDGRPPAWPAPCCA